MSPATAQEIRTANIITAIIFAIGFGVFMMLTYPGSLEDQIEEHRTACAARGGELEVVTSNVVICSGEN